MTPTRTLLFLRGASSLLARRKSRAARRASCKAVVSGAVLVGATLSANAMLSASTVTKQSTNQLKAHQNNFPLSPQHEDYGHWNTKAEQVWDQKPSNWRRQFLRLRGNHFYLPYLYRRLNNWRSSNKVVLRLPNTPRGREIYSESVFLQSLREKQRRLFRKLQRQPKPKALRPDNNNYYPDLTRFIGDKNHQPVPPRYIPPIQPAIFIATSGHCEVDGICYCYRTQVYNPPEVVAKKHHNHLEALAKERKQSAKYLKIQGRLRQTNDLHTCSRPPPISLHRTELDQVGLQKSEISQTPLKAPCIPDTHPRLLTPTATDYAFRWDQAYLCYKSKPSSVGRSSSANQQTSNGNQSKAQNAVPAQPHEICPAALIEQNDKPFLTTPCNTPSTPKSVRWNLDGNCSSSQKNALSSKSILKSSCHPILASTLPSLNPKHQKLYHIEAESRYLSDYKTSKAADLSRREIELKQAHQTHLEFEVLRKQYIPRGRQSSSAGATPPGFSSSTSSRVQTPKSSPFPSEAPTTGTSITCVEPSGISSDSLGAPKTCIPSSEPASEINCDGTRISEDLQYNLSRNRKCSSHIEPVPASGLGINTFASESRLTRLSGSTLGSRVNTWASTQTVCDETLEGVDNAPDFPSLVSFTDFQQRFPKGTLVQAPDGEYFDPNLEPRSVKNFVVTNKSILRYEEALSSRAKVFVLEEPLRSSTQSLPTGVSSTPSFSTEQQAGDQIVPRTVGTGEFTEVNLPEDKEEEPPVVVHGVKVPRQRLLERRRSYARPLSILTRLQTVSPETTPYTSQPPLSRCHSSNARPLSILTRLHAASPTESVLSLESPQSPYPPPIPRRSSKRPRYQALNSFPVERVALTLVDTTLPRNEKFVTEQELFEQNHHLLVSEEGPFPQNREALTEQELFEQNHQLLVIEGRTRKIESENTSTPTTEASFLTRGVNQVPSRFVSARQVDATSNSKSTSYPYLRHHFPSSPPTPPLTPYQVSSPCHKRSSEEADYALPLPLASGPCGRLRRSRAFSGKRENPLSTRVKPPPVPNYPPQSHQNLSTPRQRHSPEQTSCEPLRRSNCRPLNFTPSPSLHQDFSDSQTSSVTGDLGSYPLKSAQTPIQPSEAVSFLGKSETMDSSRLSSRPQAVTAMMNDAKKMQLSVMEDCKKTGKIPPKYNLLQLIGKGSFGRVYKAKDMVTAQVVAVKTIDIDESDTLNPREANAYVDFLKEVNALTALSEIKARNINHVIEALPVGKSMWMITEYCAGGSVSTLMNPTRPGGLQEKWIIPILREVAEAIRWVHSVKMIHRDIKCGNILVTEEGGVQLCDFGIASILESKLEKRKTFIGTPNWMAPELFDDQVVYGQDIDIWAFGAMAYEIAHGFPPNAGTQFQQLGLKLKQSVPRLEGDNYSTELQNIVAYCLEPIPSARPAIEDVEKHPYIFGTSELYPTSSLTQLIKAYKIWEDHGGSRRSMMYPGGAAGPSDTDSGNGGAAEWNFSTTDDFGREVEKSENAQDVFDAYGTAIDLDASFAQSSSRPKGRRRPPPQIMGRNFRQPIEKVFDPHTFSNYDENSRAQYRNRQEPPPTSDLPLRNNDNETSIRDTMIDLGGHDVETGLSSFPDMDTIKAGRRDRDDAGDDYASSPQSFSRPALSDPEQLNNNRRTQDWKFPSMAPPASADPEISRFPSSYEIPRPLITPGSGDRPALVHHPTEPLGGLFGGMPSANNAAARDSAYSLMIDLDDAIRVPAPIDYSARPSTANSDVGSVTSEQASSRNPFEFERHASRVPQFDGPNDLADPQIYITGEQPESEHSRTGSGPRDLGDVSDFSVSDVEGTQRNGEKFFSEASDSDHISMPPPPRPSSSAQNQNPLMMTQFPDLPPPPSAAALSGTASDANMAMEFHRMIDGLSEQLHTFKHAYEQLKPITVTRRPSQRREAEEEPAAAALS
ncbi:hypothetical protein BP5796_05960 [Coleophoma crateriformis]|uniref:non-specific serine/threonine protein kinase n=1 Tax=Coleophoma crateriformis TaxID=565419 RepID=A0A3D8RVU1_9HELO|nr:hypothetical protein BP5796_05960 [Coleophoma crateriformis]